MRKFCDLVRFDYKDLVFGCDLVWILKFRIRLSFKLEFYRSGKRNRRMHKIPLLTASDKVFLRIRKSEILFLNPITERERQGFFSNWKSGELFFETQCFLISSIVIESFVY